MLGTRRIVSAIPVVRELSLFFDRLNSTRILCMPLSIPLPDVRATSDAGFFKNGPPAARYRKVRP